MSSCYRSRSELFDSSLNLQARYLIDAQGVAHDALVLKSTQAKEPRVLSKLDFLPHAPTLLSPIDVLHHRFTNNLSLQPLYSRYLNPGVYKSVTSS